MPKMEIMKRPVEKMGGDIKKTAWGAIIESLITLALGIFLIAWPELVIKILAYIIGVFFIVKGGYQIINYFVIKGQNDFFNNDLLMGVISLLVGVAALVMGEELAAVFRIVVGIWIIYEALVRIDTAIKLATARINTWSYTLILAIIMLLLGIFVTFNTGAGTVLVGWMMILAGIAGIVGGTMFIQHVNQIIDKITKD
ncbi:MAG: DUF308 domain-containing protein [Candidatus Saccharibacteria bacterium]|nr:DUF308 domain-containing protein [Candidatus Saccharibacteria bacterium]